MQQNWHTFTVFHADKNELDDYFGQLPEDLFLDGKSRSHISKPFWGYCFEESRITESIIVSISIKTCGI